MGCMASGVQSVPLGVVALALSLWALGGPACSPTRCMPDHGVAEEDASATVMTEFFTNGWPPELSPIRSLVPLAIHILRAQGLHEAPDVGLVPRQLLFDTVMNDDSFLTMDADVINTLVDKMRDMARAHLDGWSDFRLRRIFAKVDSEVQAPRPRAASWTHSAVVPAGRFNSKARADAAARNLGRLAMSVLDGDNTSPAAPPPLTLQTQTESEMTKLLDSIHVWVCKHAPESPRMAELGSMPTVVELNLQRDMYREGSRSVQVVRNRFRLARNMHADIRSVGWELHEVTPWRIAAWAKGQKSRCKTGAAQAKLAILWLERCLGYDMYSKHTLVTAQMKQTKEGAKEKPASAKAPPLEVALSLEEQIWKAPTPILQAFAGAATLSTLGSCRWSDANRCRNISLTDDAILGERLSKTSSEWEPWQAMAMGISGAQWARQWLLVLAEQNLPGADFVLQGCNSRFTQWKPRVAEYNDAERALRVLLMLPPLNYFPDQAIELTWHSLRHLFPTVATQLNLSATQIEDLGAWRRGSGMVDRYNSVAGSRDLVTRAYITEVLRQGWRPATRGNIPSPAPFTPRMATVPATPTLLPKSAGPAPATLPFLAKPAQKGLAPQPAPSMPGPAALQTPTSARPEGVSAFGLAAERLNASVYLHKVRRMLHLCDGGGWSMCSTWAIMRAAEGGGTQTSEAAQLVALHDLYQFEKDDSSCEQCLRGRARLAISRVLCKRHRKD